MNTLITGIIYHVVDNTNGEVVKVGSTTQKLSIRWQGYNRNKYSNHFLKEIRVIHSSEMDWYKKGDSSSPFIWHLIAAEHMEMLKQGTFRKGPLSNKQSPLDQKYFGFDGSTAGKIGGSISGRKHVESGHLAKIQLLSKANQIKQGKIFADRMRSGEYTNLPQFIKARSENGKKSRDSGRLSEMGVIGGRFNVESGHLAWVNTLSQTIKARRRNGVNNAKNGVCARISCLGVHARTHINRNRPSVRCILCSEQSLVVAYS